MYLIEITYNGSHVFIMYAIAYIVLTCTWLKLHIMLHMCLLCTPSRT